ncbi:MAG TPA: hypothetical protein VGO62_06880 [Myxococcota bacterium]
MRSLIVVGALMTMAALGCEPEIGGLCDPDAKKVLQHIEVKKGTNNLVQDVELDNCSEGFCLSTDGSRPYCTKSCAADGECVAEAGAGFACVAVIAFGPLACTDFEDPAKPRPGSSGSPCSLDSDCTVAKETCLGADGTDKTCGRPGRDCLTGNDDGTAPSTLPLKYCNASPQTITARDKQYGRQ